MLKFKGGMNPAPVIEVQYADGMALKLSFWCDKKKGIDPQAGIRFANLVHASSAWDTANAARLEKAYYHPPMDERGNRVLDANKAVKANAVLAELNAERVAYVRQCTDQPVEVFINHPTIGRKHPAELVNITQKKKPPAKGTITVTVQGGLVQDVTGIPSGVTVEILDFDEGDESHPTWNAARACFVTQYGG